MTANMAAARNSKVGDIATDNIMDMAKAVAFRCARARKEGVGGVLVAVTGAGEVYATRLSSPKSLAAVSRPEWHVGTYEGIVSADFIADDLRVRALELGVVA